MSENNKFKYVKINGVKIPILATLDSKTEKVTFVEGAEEYLKEMKKDKENKK